MGKKETIPEQDTGESQDTASWFVSTTLASGPDLPTGTVTFLFTDIEGSTPHWEHHPELMEEAFKPARVALGESRYEALLGEGQAVLVEEVVVYAEKVLKG